MMFLDNAKMPLIPGRVNVVKKWKNVSSWEISSDRYD